MELSFLPLIIASFAVDFWWIILPTQLLVFYFWFSKWQRKLNKYNGTYFTIVTTVFFITLDLLGLLFFSQETIRTTPPLWIILFLAICFVISLFLFIAGLIATTTKHFLTH